jgi:hypothetical protein
MTASILKRSSIILKGLGLLGPLVIYLIKTYFSEKFQSIRPAHLTANTNANVVVNGLMDVTYQIKEQIFSDQFVDIIKTQPSFILIGFGLGIIALILDFIATYKK